LGNSLKSTKDVGHSQSLLAKQEFIAEMLSSKVVYLLLNKESSKGEELPEEARGLVKEFANVFPGELPNELPPFHDIQHQIDLASGSSFPN
jgi:hypothetical protein